MHFIPPVAPKSLILRRIGLTVDRARFTPPDTMSMRTFRPAPTRGATGVCGCPQACKGISDFSRLARPAHGPASRSFAANRPSLKLKGRSPVQSIPTPNANRVLHGRPATPTWPAITARRRSFATAQAEGQGQDRGLHRHRRALDPCSVETLPGRHRLPCRGGSPSLLGAAPLCPPRGRGALHCPHRGDLPRRRAQGCAAESNCAGRHEDLLRRFRHGVTTGAAARASSTSFATSDRMDFQWNSASGFNAELCPVKWVSSIGL